MNGTSIAEYTRYDKNGVAYSVELLFDSTAGSKHPWRINVTDNTEVGGNAKLHYSLEQHATQRFRTLVEGDVHRAFPFNR